MIAIFNWFRRHKVITALCTCIWAAIILGACLIPGRDVPSLSIFQYDKVVHFGIFALLAFLILLSKKTVCRKDYFVIFAGVTAYGFLVECLQGSGITEGRSFDLLDALADSIGALIGVLVFAGLDYWSKRKV